MRLILPRLLLAVLIGAASSVAAQTDPPVTDADRTIYNTLYREKLTSVNRTRSTEDDLTLAREMLAFAKQIPDDTGVQCLIYIDVITLSAAGADLAMMQEAAGLLEKLWPEHEAVSPDKLLELAGRAYRSVTRSSRTEVGEQYVSLLVDIAKRAEENRELDQALNVCRQASTIARSLESDQRQAIDNMLARLAAESAVSSRIDMLTLSVRKAPQNTPAARELVALLMTKRNDPAAAAEFVASTKDEELIDLITLCAQGFEQATAPTAMRLGDWYLALAEDQPDRYALPLLQDAQAWYQRFFSLYPREDALAKRTRQMEQAAALKLEALNQEATRLKQDPTDWIDLIKDRFDLETHVTAGEARVQDNQLLCKDAKLIMPAPVSDSYEIKTTLAIMTEENSSSPIEVILPVGDRFIRFKYMWRGSIVAWGDTDDLRYNDLNRESTLGQAQKMHFQVATSPTGSAAAVMLLNGKRVLFWKGQIQDLHSHEYFELPEEAKTKIHILTRNETIIYSASYRKQGQ